MKETIVLYPAPGFHHMLSLVELSKLILQQNSNLSTTILVPSTPLEESKTHTYINSISQTNLSISFCYLPSIQTSSSTRTRAEMAFESLELNASNVFQAMETIGLSSKILCLITSSIAHVSYHPNIPTYAYFTSCASALATILYLPTLHNQTNSSLKDQPSSLLFIPGLPPIKSSFMPEPLLHRHEPGYDFFLNFSDSLAKSSGIIVNTFESLEPKAISAIVNGACVTSGTTPTLYCIGPLIVDAKDRAGGTTMVHVSSDCLTWLDAQPSRSVLFLCFGSRGTFSSAQLREIAVGLERSNQRFLWVVKSPPDSDDALRLESLLPEGFLDRNREKGLMVKSWAPQSAILSHESVSGFVTHCGWNSVLEAVTYGVPMIAWPLYAEQFMNSVVLVQEMKLAIPINLSAEILEEEEDDDDDDEEKGQGLVSAEDVEKRVKALMGADGKVLRERSLEMRAMAMAAWNNGTGGSSLTSFSKLVASWN